MDNGNLSRLHVIDTAKLTADLDNFPAESPFSGVVTVYQRGEQVFAKAYGYANKSDSLPNKIDTKFAIASGAKTFTAVAVCQLVEQGKLSLDARLVDVLDSPFPRFDPAVTVQHLLSHTSGIPDYFDEEVMDDYEALWAERPMYNIRAPKDFLPLFQNQPMKSAPGERFAYSNAGYIVLGLIVEQASGMVFSDCVRQHIFEPCGMRGSGYFRTDRLPANSATGYIRDADGGWRSNIYAVPIVGGPDGGVFTTAPDVHRFWDNLRNNRLLGEGMTRAMLSVQAKENDDTAYGYGVWLKTADGAVTRVHMEGADPGVGFFSAVYPASEIEFTVIGNTGDDTWLAVRAVRDAVEAADPA
jgi:CubicO group peptidase (beta-lactamase class C family)